MENSLAKSAECSAAKKAVKSEFVFQSCHYDAAANSYATPMQPNIWHMQKLSYCMEEFHCC